MFESGYYPAGAEYDSAAPYNEVEVTSMCTYTEEVVYVIGCDEIESERLASRLIEDLNSRDAVLCVDNISSEYDDGELAVYLSAAIEVEVTVYGNCIDDPNPEPTEDEIRQAADEQAVEILSVNNWLLEWQ